MDLNLLTVAQAALVPVVIGVVQAIKTTNLVAERYYPLVSIGCGVIAAFVLPSASIALTALSGVVIGLSASGLYSGTKKFTA